MAILHLDSYATHRPRIFTEKDRRELDRMTSVLCAYDMALERLESDLDLLSKLHDGMSAYPNDPGLSFVFKESLEHLHSTYSMEGALQTMWDGIKKFFATIVEKIKQFFLWVARLFGFCKTEADKSGAILKELKAVLELFDKADQNKKTAILQKITEYRRGGIDKVEKSTQTLLDARDVWGLVDSSEADYIEGGNANDNNNAPKNEQSKQEEKKQEQQPKQQNVEPPPITAATSAAGNADECYLSELPVVANGIASLKDKAAAVRPALSKYVDTLKGVQNLTDSNSFANAQSGNLEGGQQLTEAAKSYMEERNKLNQAQAPSGSDSYVKYDSYETLNTNIGNFESEAKQLSEATKLLADQLDRVSKLTVPATESLIYSFEADEQGSTRPPQNPPSGPNTTASQPNQPTQGGATGQVNNNTNNNNDSATAKQIMDVIKKMGQSASEVMKNIVRIENDCANTRSNFNKMMGSVTKIIADGLKDQPAAETSK